MTPSEKAVMTLRLAALSGTYMGLIRTPADQAYMRRCTTAVRRGDTIDQLLYTRDEGHHANGWWKNPDYERCFHLSVSFSYLNGEPAPWSDERGAKWARQFFRDDTRWVWVEPPYSEVGKVRGVHHYRLFCDPGWQPMKPRGEVYSKEFTEAGWKSFSELHGQRERDRSDPPMGYEA